MPPKATSTEPSAPVVTLSRPSPMRTQPLMTLEKLSFFNALADVLFKGGLAPVFVKRPEGLVALMVVGDSVGLSPTASIANIMIVNGKSTIWGDAVPALVIQSGLLEERKEWYEGDVGDDNYTAVISLKRVGEADARVTRFSVDEAKRAHLWGKKGPWTEYPERQLMWRARGWCYRDTFPDVMCGLVFAEEAIDIPEPTGRVTTVEQKEADPMPQLNAKGPGKPFTNPPAIPAVADEETGPNDEQFERLMELRNAACTAKNANTEEAMKEVWADILAPYKVKSVTQMTSMQINELIEQLGKAHDPFTHPPAVATPTTSAPSTLAT